MAINTEKKWRDGKDVFALLMFLREKGGKRSFAEIAKHKKIKQYSSAALRADEKKILTLGYKVSLTPIYEPAFRTTYKDSVNSKVGVGTRTYSNAVQANMEEITQTLRELNRSSKRYNGTVYGPINPLPDEKVVEVKKTNEKDPLSYMPEEAREKVRQLLERPEYDEEGAVVEQQSVEEPKVVKQPEPTTVSESEEPEQFVMIQTTLSDKEVKTLFPGAILMALNDEDGDLYKTSLPEDMDLSKIDPDKIKFFNVTVNTHIHSVIEKKRKYAEDLEAEMQRIMSEAEAKIAEAQKIFETKCKEITW